MNKILEFLPYVIGGYEVITRLYPSKKDYTFVGKVLNVLKFVSNLLNREKPYIINKTKLIVSAILILSCFSISCSALKKIQCIEATTIQVKIVTEKGNSFDVNVPFCTVIMIKEKNLPDSLKNK